MARDRGSRIQAALASLALATAIAGCGSSKPGGYYRDDGPGGRPPVDLDRVADAKPKLEPLNQTANNPYTALGRKYTPYRSVKPHRERGLASWYGRGFHGKRTASGERYDMYAMTAAHTILPIPSYARVTHLGNGRSVIVRINDRGPFRTDRIIDLSYAAARSHSSLPDRAYTLALRYTQATDKTRNQPTTREKIRRKYTINASAQQPR